LPEKYRARQAATRRLLPLQRLRFPCRYQAGTVCSAIWKYGAAENRPEIEALTQYLHGKVWWTTRSKSKNYSTPRLSTLQKSDNEAAFPYCGGLNLANSTQCLCAIMFTALNRFD